MSEETDKIPVKWLMEELNIEWKSLKQLSKSCHIGQIKRNGCISRNIANQISLEHRGIPIDLSKLKTEVKDNNIGGIIRRQSFSSNLLEDWYLKLDDVDDDGLSSSFLGIVFTGGFLQGKSNDDEPVIISLKKGINIFIGERGSGKSTALSMLTLLSDSISKKTDILIKEILTLLKAKEIEIDDNKWERNVWEILKKYSIEQYACYFYQNNKLLCFYVNRDNQEYNFFVKEQEKWFIFEGKSNDILPKMQVLRQGEVFRIADDEKQYVINNIIDVLYPKLYDQRKKLGYQYIDLIKNFRNFNIEEFTIDRQTIDRFYGQYVQELEQLENANRSGDTFFILNKLESYYRNSETLSQYLFTSPIFELFNPENGERGLFCFYIGRISSFIREKRSRIKELNNQLDNEINKKEIYNLIRENTNEVLNFLRPRINLIREIEYLLDKLPVYNDNLSSICKQYISLIENQLSLIKTQESCCDEINQVIQENLKIYLFTDNAEKLIEDNEAILNFLKNVKENYTFISNADMMTSESDYLKALNNYKNLMIQVFNKLNKNRDPNFLQFEKLDPQDFVNIIFYPVELQFLQGNDYRSFKQLSFGQKSGIILTIALKMTQADIIVIDQPEDNLDSDSIINLLAPTLSSENQNNNNRIIIIATHNSNLVMTLASQQPYIFVMKTLGESGCLDISGNLQEKAIVKYMFNVLEGGINAYEEKLKLYEKFIEELANQNKDIDIAFIERSHRRNIINSFRNYLQPVVSDRFILKSLRHELGNLAQKREKLLNSSWWRQSLVELQEDINIKKSKNLDNLNGFTKTFQKCISQFLIFLGLSQNYKNHNLISILNKIDDFIKSLDNHLNQINITIEQINEMDTNPKPKEFMLYLLLEEVVEAIKDRKDEVNFDLSDQKLGEIKIHADPNHTKLIFRNIFKNAARATEIKAVDSWDNIDYIQRISVRVIETNPFNQYLRQKKTIISTICQKFSVDLTKFFELFVDFICT